MFFCGSDYRFHFEIVVILVIALIIYVFISIAWIVGQSLMRIQEKVNQHEFTIADRKYVSQPDKYQRTALTTSIDGAYLQYGEPGFERAREARNELDRKQEDVRRACNRLKDMAGMLKDCDDLTKKVKLGDNNRAEDKEHIDKVKEKLDTLRKDIRVVSEDILRHPL